MAFSDSSSLMVRLNEIIGNSSVTLNLNKGGRYADVADGSRIAAVKAVISAGGRSGGAALSALLDNAASVLEGYYDGEILKISADFPTVLCRSDSDGFMRFEKEIEIIIAAGRGDRSEDQ